MEALPPQRLGQNGPEMPPLGTGTWQWGDRRYWQFDPVNGPGEARDAFHASLEAGIRLFDTAEIYGGGVSERLLGSLIRESGSEVVVATKFAPLPQRLSPDSLLAALDRSLERLGLGAVDLYQVHWPYTLLPVGALMKRMAKAVQDGKVRQVGVSNYSAAQMRKAHEALMAHGIPLASNQVAYSLLTREAERNGVQETCAELDATLLAYSPLAKGALTGKYRPDGLRPGGARRFSKGFRNLARAMPVVDTLREVGERHGASPSQVALNWLARQPGVIPIPGAKNGTQATENAGAVAFTISADEADELDAVSRRFR